MAQKKETTEVYLDLDQSNCGFYNTSGAPGWDLPETNMIVPPALKNTVSLTKPIKGSITISDNSGSFWDTFHSGSLATTEIPLILKEELESLKKENSELKDRLSELESKMEVMEYFKE